MRQNLYTCCRCGYEQRTAVENDSAPLGWAAVSYQCEHVEMVGGSRQLMLTELSTHACANCRGEVLIFLEKVTAPSKEVDRAFDDGGVA